MTAENERKRLRRADQIDLVDLMGIADRCEQVFNSRSMTERLKMVPRGRWRLAVAKSMLLNLVEKLLDTVPGDQLLHMRKNLRHVKCHIYVGGVADQRDRIEGRWFNINELNVIASAVRECCVTCDRDPQEQRSCPYKKLMDCLPVDPDDGRDCGWYTKLGSI